jgi:hypothetical protein
VFNRAKDPDERAARDAAKADEHAAKEAAKAEEERRKEHERFLASPVGQARTAFESGDAVFQATFTINETRAEVVSMVGAYAKTRAKDDPTSILNGICREGWDVVNASFVFRELGSVSRDKFLSSGQQVAVKGDVVGYYVFRRAEGNRQLAA